MPPPENEESAKFQILAPTLRSLGWDTSQPEEVIYELQVGGNRGGGRADIVLKSNDRIVALIEAKAPGANLNHHVGQVLTYAFHEGVDICVLTTGLEWWLYLPREQGPPQDRRFAILKLAEDPIEQLLGDLHAFLSKEMLVDGRAEKRAQAVLRASHEAAQLSKEVPGIWQEMLKEPDDELLEILGRRVYEKVSLRPTKPQLVAALQGSPIPLAAIAPEGMTAKTSPIPQQQAKSGQRKKNPKPVAMELWGQHFGVETAADAFKKVVDLLFERHRDEFHRVLELRGHKYPHAAPDLAMLGPRSQQNNYEHEASGYFFDLHLSNNNKIRRARQLLEQFGHDSADLKLLYEGPSTDNSSVTSSPAQSQQGSESRQQIQNLRPVAMELWGQHYEVESNVDAFRKVLDLLFERHSHEFHRLLDFRTGSYPAVAINPEMLRVSGRRRNYKQPSSGYFFDINLKGEYLKKRAHQFLELFGHDPADFKVLYEDYFTDITAKDNVENAGSNEPRHKLKLGSLHANPKPTAMELWGERREIESHSDALRIVLDLLFELHSGQFHRILELRGRKHPFAAQNPEMLSPIARKRNYQQKSSGYFFDLHLSGKDTTNRARLFLKHFGHDPSDFKILYE